MKRLHFAFLGFIIIAVACDESQDKATVFPSVSEETGQGAAAGVSAPPSMRDDADLSRSGDAAGKGGFALQGRAGSMTAPTAEPSPRDPTQYQPGSATPSMIIRTGQAGIEVDSVQIAVAHLRQLAQRLGGYVANTNMQFGEEQNRSATLELKIPAERFEQAVGGLEPIGKVEYVNVNAEDVSEEFVDVTARVANARRLEERLIELLANRTGRLQDVLAVERELARVREEIERFEGRLRFLRTRASMSTLTVTVHKKLPIVGRRGWTTVIVEAFRSAWRNFINLVAAVIASLGIVIPLALLGLAGWLIYRKYRRPKQPPKQE